MFKKFSITIIAMILTVGLLTGIASAEATTAGKAGEERAPNHRALIGKVLEIGTADFTVEGLNGDLHIIKVTNETTFRSRDGEEASEAAFSDLAIGQYVGVYNKKNDAGGVSARLIVLLPDDFDPSQLKLKKFTGEVSMVTTGGGFFKMETLDGETIQINVDENTRYAGGIASLSDLEKGDKLAVAAREQEDGTFLAKAVATQKEDQRQFAQTNGTLTGISGDMLTITDRREESHTFTVTENTRYGDRGGEVSGLEDLETGMVVVIIHLKETEVNEAKAVMVADQAILSLKRATGKIKSINANQLTLDANGEVMQFSIEENTRINGRNINSIDDLDKDMRVLVLYQEDDSGKLIARSITNAKRQNKDQ